jgi:hypothetical protein
MASITLLASIAQQMMASDKVDVNGKPQSVRRTSLDIGSPRFKQGAYHGVESLHCGFSV